MITNTKYYLCKSCANRTKTLDGQDKCNLHVCPIDINKDFCSWNTSQTGNFTCPICQKSKRSKEFYVYTFETKNLMVCEECVQHIGTCATCANQHCKLMDDNSEPHTVTRTIRQGAMIMQTQVTNPNLVVKHCQKCKCSNGVDPAIQDIVCFKGQNGSSCSNWQILPELLQ
jgi:hypothetical protein